MVAPLKVGIAGLGTVGAEVVRLIEEQSRLLSARSGRGIRVVAVTARSKVKKRGVNLRGIDWAKSPLALATDPNVDCFVELMGGSGDPAFSAVEAALKAGKSVVTANKALVAKHGIRLAKAAEKNAPAPVTEASPLQKKEQQGVFLIREGKAVFVPVATGITGQTEIEVLSGLKPGDEIVTGSYKILRTLKTDTQIKVDNSSPDKFEKKELL